MAGMFQKLIISQKGLNLYLRGIYFFFFIYGLTSCFHIPNQPELYIWGLQGYCSYCPYTDDHDLGLEALISTKGKREEGKISDWVFNLKRNGHVLYSIDEFNFMKFQLEIVEFESRMGMREDPKIRLGIPGCYTGKPFGGGAIPDQVEFQCTFHLSSGKKIKISGEDNFEYYEY